MTWSTKKGAENKSITEPNLDDVYVSMYMYIHTYVVTVVGAEARGQARTQ